MRVKPEEAVSTALDEIASWYSTGETPEATSSEAPETRWPLPSEASRFRRRLSLLAVLVVILAGVGGAAALGRSATDEPAGLTASLDRDTVVDLCLDIDTGYDLEDVATDGTLHLFVDGGSDQVPLIMSSGALHVTCGLARRADGEWFRVVSLAGSHPPLASSDDVDVLVAIEIRDRTYVAGRAGTDVDSIEVERHDGTHEARIEDGWWGVSFDAADDHDEPFPPFSIRWRTSSGTTERARGVDLVVPEPWTLCAQTTSCREARTVELLELARGSEYDEQATILADGVVTRDEYRAALRSWGVCIADSTGAEVTFDDSGLFTIHDAGDQVTAAFERCEEVHIAFVAEALGLAGAATDE